MSLKHLLGKAVAVTILTGLGYTTYKLGTAPIPIQNAAPPAIYEGLSPQEIVNLPIPPSQLIISPIEDPTIRNKTWALDTLLEKNTSAAQFVHIFPKGSRTTTPYVVLYATIPQEKEWCVPCVALRNAHFEDELEQKISKRADIALIKLEQGDPAPQFFQENTGVPQIIIAENKEGIIRPLTDVSYEDPTQAAGQTLEVLAEVKQGKVPPTQIINDEILRKYPVEFCLDPEEDPTGHDRLAVITGYALFPCQWSYNASSGRMVFTADLTQPEQMRAVRNREGGQTTAYRGRHIMDILRSNAASYRHERSAENKLLREHGESLDAKRGLYQKNIREGKIDWEGFRKTEWEFANLSEKCFPPSLEVIARTDRMHAQRVFEGEEIRYTYVGDLLARQVTHAFDEWAIKNKKEQDARHIPSSNEINSWTEQYGIPPERCAALCTIQESFARARSFLEGHNIMYVDPSIPAAILEAHLKKADTTVVLAGVPLHDIITCANQYAEEPSTTLRNFYTPEALFTLADNYPTSMYDVAYILISGEARTLSAEADPYSSLARYFDPAGVHTGGAGLVVLDRQNQLRTCTNQGAQEPTPRTLEEDIKIKKWIKRK